MKIKLIEYIIDKNKLDTNGILNDLYEILVERDYEFIENLKGKLEREDRLEREKKNNE